MKITGGMFVMRNLCGRGVCVWRRDGDRNRKSITVFILQNIIFRHFHAIVVQSVVDSHKHVAGVTK